jgi:hypothetical protein
MGNEKLVIIGQQTLAALDKSSVANRLFSLRTQPSVYPGDDRWVSLSNRVESELLKGLWLWSDEHVDDGKPVQLLWFGFEIENEHMEAVHVLRDGLNAIGWVDPQPAPDLRHTVVENEPGFAYIGIYQDFSRQESSNEFHQRCISFLEQVIGIVLGTDLTVDSDIDEIKKSDRSKTEKRRLIRARLGQGQFRITLLAAWENRCAVTGSNVFEAIRASHAKPWRASTDEERLSAANGLPLIATLDALFDAGLITFEDGGDLRLSVQLTTREREDLDQLGLSDRSCLRRKPKTEEAKFLAYHRQHVFRS